MSRIPHVCPKCKGEGYIMNRGQQLAAGIISLGVIPLMDAVLSNGPRESHLSRKCPICKGTGWIALGGTNAE